MDQLIALIQHHGLWLVFANVLIEQAGLPVPAYPTLVIAGAYLTGGRHALVALLLVGAMVAMIAGCWQGPPLAAAKPPVYVANRAVANRTEVRVVGAPFVPNVSPRDR